MSDLVLIFLTSLWVSASSGVFWVGFYDYRDPPWVVALCFFACYLFGPPLLIAVLGHKLWKAVVGFLRSLGVLQKPPTVRHDYCTSCGKPSSKWYCEDCEPELPLKRGDN